MNKKIKIEIKSFGGKVLFEYDSTTNNLKKTLVKAVEQGAYLQGADLQGADLQGADLHGADLHGADLQGADLQGAYLHGAYLQGAYLQGAYLRGADLQGAYLHGADLQGADLHGACLRGVKNIPNIYKTPLHLLKYQPKNTKLRAFKYLNGNISPYQNFEYEIGKTYTVENSDDDEMILCAEGINVATLDWCLRDTNCDLTKTYIEVEFCVKDLIIPYNSDGKFRIKKGGKVRVVKKLTKKKLEEAIKPINSTA